MIDLCRKAAELNHACPYRRGSVVYLPDEGDIIVTGDLHGHARNFQRIVSYADLGNHPNRHVVLQEILHGGPEDEQGGCLSFHLFCSVLQYHIDFPHRVHLILGNHDTAIINDFDVVKAGKEMNQALKAAMRRRFADDYPAVIVALRDMLLSQPLVVRCPHRIWVSHSLPACQSGRFDISILDRNPAAADCTRPHAAYLLTWGRRHSPEMLSDLAKTFAVDTFILGHQPQEQGWARVADNVLVLACDHGHGCVLPFELDTPYTTDELERRIVPLASIE